MSPDPGAPPSRRPSDAERERVVARLAEGLAEGRITLDELEQRVERAYGAQSAGELDGLMRDLPEPSPASAARAPVRWRVEVMGGSDLTGRFRVGERLRSVALMGGGTIDLRGAELSGEGLDVLAVAVMGGIDILVPDTVEVDTSGLAIMGGNDVRGGGRAPRPGAPTIRVRAYSLMGGIDVWRLPAETRGMSPREARRAVRALTRGG